MMKRMWAGGRARRALCAAVIVLTVAVADSAAEAIGGPPGIAATAGPQGVAAALRTLAAGGEIDYEGASGSIDWDESGDLRRGHVGVWRFTADERIEETAAVAFAR